MVASPEELTDCERSVHGFRTERDAILDAPKSLNHDEWNLPSDCKGWAVRDLFGHMACTLDGIVDPNFLPARRAATHRTRAGSCRP
jgi:hypothetical protein